MKTTKNQQTASDISALLRARTSLLWVVTREEARVEAMLFEAAASAKYEVRTWDCAQGLVDVTGAPVGPGQQLADPNALLAYVRDTKTTRAVYVLRDMHKWLDPVVLRALRNLARSLQGAPRNEARSLVILTPSAEVPPELTGHAVVVDWPLPERVEIASILDDVLRALPPELAGAALNGDRDAAIDAAVGLSGEEAASCFAKSLVTSRRIDPAVVSSEKRRVIAREKVLTWFEPEAGGLAAIGGLEELKLRLELLEQMFTQRARDFGCPAPRGYLLVGVPGCGKSLTAKAVAAAWRLPLLRLDLGALRSKYVGESEGNIRKALATAEAVSPCVLWVDEIEKALAGATGEQGDGGVAKDALGAVLNWMQERAGAVFVVATANDVSALPAELLRRFDKLFMVDLPTTEERMRIVEVAVRKHRRDPNAIDVFAVAEATRGFTGAEIAGLVPEALYAAFAEGERAITTDDLLAAAKQVVPLSQTAAEKVEALRAWAKGRATPASTPERTNTNSGRALDI